MTKSEELIILRETLERLGPDSYLGPWLAEQFPGIEQDLQSDHMPVITHRACVDACNSMIANARHQAADIEKAARAKADSITVEASNERDAICQSLRSALQRLHY